MCFTWKKTSLDARTTLEMTEKNDVMIKAVLDPSSRLLENENKNS